MKYLLFLLLLSPFVTMAQRPVDISSMSVAGGPFLSQVSSFTAFGSTSGSPSTSQSGTVSGNNLTNNVVITSPSSFEVSLDNTTFSSSVTITQSGGTIPSQPKLFYIRITAVAAIGSPTGNISITSTGASPLSIPISGVVSSGSSAHWRAITIPSSSVSGGSDLTNFTAEIQITGSYLATVANGGKVQNASGFDINFAADNAGVTLYKWEIESWNPVTGALTAWVKIPLLSASTTTTVYLLYGGTATTFQGGSTGSAWDANTIAVYHNSEVITASGQTIKDWSANGHNQTSAGTWTSAQSVAGVAGNALKYLNANSDRSTFTSISVPSTSTIEGWYQSTSGLVDGDTYSWANSSTFDVIAFGDPGGFLGLFSGAGPKIQDVSSVVGNTWYHVVFTQNGTSWKMYRNGSLTTSNSTAVSIAFNNMGTLFGGFTNDEIIDEPRMASVERTAGWIATEYSNMNANGTWKSVGAEN